MTGTLQTQLKVSLVVRSRWETRHLDSAPSPWNRPSIPSRYTVFVTYSPSGTTVVEETPRGDEHQSFAGGLKQTASYAGVIVNDGRSCCNCAMGAERWPDGVLQCPRSSDKVSVVHIGRTPKQPDVPYTPRYYWQQCSMEQRD